MSRTEHSRADRESFSASCHVSHGRRCTASAPGGDHPAGCVSISEVGRAARRDDIRSTSLTHSIDEGARARAARHCPRRPSGQDEADGNSRNSIRHASGRSISSARYGPSRYDIRGTSHRLARLRRVWDRRCFRYAVPPDAPPSPRDSWRTPPSAKDDREPIRRAPRSLQRGTARTPRLPARPPRPPVCSART